VRVFASVWFMTLRQLIHIRSPIGEDGKIGEDISVIFVPRNIYTSFVGILLDFYLPHLPIFPDIDNNSIFEGKIWGRWEDSSSICLR
jgi:hypothetical protein